MNIGVKDTSGDKDHNGKDALGVRKVSYITRSSCWELAFRQLSFILEQLPQSPRNLLENRSFGKKSMESGRWTQEDCTLTKWGGQSLQAVNEVRFSASPNNLDECSR